MAGRSTSNKPPQLFFRSLPTQADFTNSSKLPPPPRLTATLRPHLSWRPQVPVPRAVPAPPPPSFFFSSDPPPKLVPRMNTSAHPHSLSPDPRHANTSTAHHQQPKISSAPTARMCDRTTALWYARHDVRIEADLHPRCRKQMRGAELEQQRQLVRRPRRVSLATVHFC